MMSYEGELDNDNKLNNFLKITNRKVAGSIQAGVIGIFYWHKILPIAL